MKKEIEITASLVAYTPNSNKIGGVNGGGQGGGGGGGGVHFRRLGLFVPKIANF